jgi:hypothetical protein
VSPWGTPGGGANPAETGCCYRWSLGLALLTAPSTDVTEHAFAGTVRTGRIGFGLRLATRQVANLFDDPVLENADLRVEDTDAALSTALAIGGGVRLGVSGLYSNSTVLGASAEGFGGRVGADYTARRWSIGAYYGTLQTGATWHIGGGGAGYPTRGMRRLALASSFDSGAFWSVLPRLTIEADRDEGDRSEQWLRASLGWRFLDGQLQILGGASGEVGPASVPTTYEAAVGVRISGFFVYMGSRLGAEPAPGNTYAVGAVVHHQ